MACIQKLKRANTFVYRAIIKKKGIKTVTKVFNTRRLALEFSNRIEASREPLVAYGNSKKIELTFHQVAEEYLSREYFGTRPIEQRRKLNFWSDTIGDKPIKYVSKSDVALALSTLPSNFKNSTINRYKAAFCVRP